MDLNIITDEKELKALAFDQLQAIEIAQTNLRAIQERMAQLNAPVPVPDDEKAADTKPVK